jgi:putative nucleotidyltransferase with HDIG domain
MAEKRILIADADRKAWEDLRGALGPSWLVVGAATGDAAMAEAHKGPFDAIVSNFHLPDLDGAELLNRLRLAHPKTVRFIAAAEGLRENISCHVLGGHQFLSLPFDKATIKSSIERSLAEDYGMNQSLRVLVGRIRTFPAIPSLYVKVVNALKNPGATTEEIGAIIGQDMAMTTKLVQVLNSAFYGLPRTITDPTEAVGILGFETVTSLIMTVKLLSQYDKIKPVYFSIDTIWRHSTNVAHTAKALARMETSDAQCSSDAYTAGLMHDLGKVILAANFDAQYDEAHAVARKRQAPLWEVEKDIFGANHADIGAYLLGLWGLSAEVVKAAACHHHPLRAGDLAFTALTAVHAANALEYEGDPHNDGSSVPVIDDAYMRQLGLEARVDVWRRARRDSEDTKFEIRMQRAKVAASSGTAKPNAATPALALDQLDASRDAGVPFPSTPVPTPEDPPAAAPAPLVPHFAPAAWWQGPSLRLSFLKWAGFGLGLSVVLALLARLEVKRSENRAGKPKVQKLAIELPRPVKYEVASAVPPAKALEAKKPTPAPPIPLAPVMSGPPAPPAVQAPAPVKTALDRLKLEAIFYSPQHPSALISGQLAGVNQFVANCRVTDIGPSSVTLEYHNQRKTLVIQ